MDTKISDADQLEYIANKLSDEGKTGWASDIKVIASSLRASTAVAEPVAWRYRDGRDKKSKWTVQKNRPHWAGAAGWERYIIEPLYTSSPPTPVADEVREALINTLRYEVLNCAHSIETEEIVLRRSNSEDGNALNQLWRRIETTVNNALATPLQTVPASEGVRAVGGGWKLVPVEPTEAMLDAGWWNGPDVEKIAATRSARERTKLIYRAMLAASPSPAPVAETVKVEPPVADGVRVLPRDNILQAWLDRLHTAKKMHGLPLILEDMMAEIGGLLAAMPDALSIGTKADDEGLRTKLAAHLCDEFDADFQPQRNATWPEDENDDGKRVGGYVAIQPEHVRARALEAADRILNLLRLAPPARTKE